MMEEETSLTKPSDNSDANSYVENVADTAIVKPNNIISVKIGTILAETVDKINNKLN